MGQASTGKLKVIIGRFQPFHNGHLELIRQIFDIDSNDHLLVIVGTPAAPYSYRNPFDLNTRVEMIDQALEPIYGWGRYSIEPVEDHFYNDTKWVSAVRDVIREVNFDIFANSRNLDNVLIYGEEHRREQMERMFINIPFNKDVVVETALDADGQDIRSSQVREDIFGGLSTLPGKLKSNYNDIVASCDEIVDSTREFILNALDQKTLEIITEDADYAIEYKKANNPEKGYPPHYVTTDAVVVCGGYVLLIERAQSPGKGLYALPGGFMDVNLSLLDNTIKELREETRLKVPKAVLYGSVVAQKTFDAVNRSSRGRVITNATLFHLTNEKGFPVVKGDDDAKNAFWIAIEELNPGEMLEDHYHIIQKMLPLLP